jgi:MFS family permease
MGKNTLADRIYDRVFEDDDDRLCDAIPERSCTDIPRNFFLNAFNGSATKLAEQIASPGLVLPWFLSALGAPAAFAGFLVPIKRVFSLLPQIVVAGSIRAYPRRKWFWVAAGSVQALMLFLVVLTAIFDGPVLTGVIVLFLFAVFSTASGVGSVAFQDVMGKTIPKGRRGRLLAVRATSGGILTLAAGAVLYTFITDESPVSTYYILIGSAAVLWMLGAFLFAQIREAEGATEGGRNAIDELKEGFRLVREVIPFRQFIITRIFYVSVALSVPFYALYARELTGAGASNLGIFVVVTGIAQILSSPFWGFFSDKSSRTVLLLSGLFAVAGGLLALILGVSSEELHTAIAYSPVFLLVGFAEAGVRVGRKTYLVDAAPERERPLYVAMSNTIVGAVALIAGGLGFIADMFGIVFLLVIFIGLAAAGSISSLVLRRAEEFQEKGGGSE